MTSLDHNLVQWLNDAAQHQPIRALAILAAKYLAAVPPLLLVGVFVWALWRRDTSNVAKAGLAGVGTAIALVANQVVGQFVTRGRPYSVLASVHAIGTKNGDSSFYSDHTTLAVGTAIGVFLVSRRLGIVALVIAAMVGAGRIAVGAHYPSDVLAAAAAAGGFVAAMVVLKAPVQRLLDRMIPARKARTSPG